ncbi:MAG: BatD family protein, partial [Chitinophagales bacterium]
PLIEPPKNIWDEDIEVYDPILKENYNVQPSFSGTKTWNYVAIPHAPGSYTTPNIEFSYFDLVQKKYVTLTAPSTNLTIVGKPTKDKEKGKKYGEFNYAKQKIRESKVYATSSNLSNGIFYGLGLLPLAIAFGIGLLPKYEKAEDRFISGKKISERVIQQMKQAEVYLNENNKEAFYQELTRTYWNYLSHKFRLETSDLTRSNIAEKLREKDVSNELITKMINLIDNSEMGLYTSYGSQAMREIYENSLVILNDIDRQIV